MSKNGIADMVVMGIRQLEAAGMSYRAIARAMGMSHVTIIKWASGEASPTAKNAQFFLDRLPRLVGVTSMVKHLGKQSDAPISSADIEAHAEALLMALDILRKLDYKSDKLLKEIDFLYTDRDEDKHKP